jgi:hypothetical protein
MAEICDGVAVVRRGVRVAALVNGGFLPEGMRGRKLEEPMHEADWCECSFSWIYLSIYVAFQPGVGLT